jgi:transcriptional regulator with PAS, ATPase and Fis domain
MSRDLLESELFGHEKGAFTGAAGTKIGLVTAASGGTLFLDELAEMPPPMQVGLLRFLDRGEYRPVGSTRTLHADVRIVAATNQDLERCISQGRFREDLFYRINTITLHVPPLRQRREDIPGLAQHMLAGNRTGGLPRRALSPEAMTALTSYSWPGNIRELRNVLERVVMMGAGDGPISREEVLAMIPQTSAGTQTRNLSDCSLEEIERMHVRRVLDANDGNKAQVARILQIDYKTLLAKMKKYGLSN